MITDWVKPYRGPFRKTEALKLAHELQWGKTSKYLIAAACVEARDEKEDEWDVLIKFNDEI